MSRSAYIGILQGSEYWHFKTDSHQTARLVEGFEFLWSLPRNVESTISTHVAGADELAYFLPEGLLPSDITESVNTTYEEILQVFRAGCKTATISLCGRVMETLLHAVYVKHSGTLPDLTWGLDAIASRLKRHGLFLPALIEQFALIKKFRNKAVHGGVEFPTEEQAEAIVLLTRDFMSQIVSQEAGKIGGPRLTA